MVNNFRTIVGTSGCVNEPMLRVRDRCRNGLFFEDQGQVVVSVAEHVLLTRLGVAIILRPAESPWPSASTATRDGPRRETAEPDPNRVLVRCPDDADTAAGSSAAAGPVVRA